MCIRDRYYDYSRIVRKSGAAIPSRKLLIIYDYYTVPATDTGDVYTVDSYDTERYKNDIPVLRNGRSSDVLDFRPRVSEFNSTTTSPFHFASRNFASSGNNPSLVVSPNASSFVGYSYYLPRIDKLVLDSTGELQILEGVSSINPKAPSSIESSMDLATLYMPAYLYNTEDVEVSLVDNKRYTCLLYTSSEPTRPY